MKSPRASSPRGWTSRMRMRWLRMRLKIAPGNAGHHLRLGQALEALGRIAEALPCFEQACALNPRDARAHGALRNALHQLGRIPEALLASDAEIALAPESGSAHGNRGVILRDLRRPAEALQCLERALTLAPSLAPAHFNRGNLLQELHRLDEARESYARALALAPEHAGMWSSYGAALHEMGLIQDAMKCFEHAIALAPEHVDAHYFKSMALLASGDYAQGWRLYEWRLRRIHRGADPLGVPRWHGGDDLAGKTILLHAEQGLGDTLQFCRYAAMVNRLGARVILGVQPELKPLLVQLAGVAVVIAPGDPFTERVDCHCPLMSLPLALGTTLSTIPAPIPYLHAGAQRAEHWRIELGATERPRVGLVWSGGFRPGQPDHWNIDRLRNVPLDALMPLSGIACDFHGLQKGEPAESEFTARMQSGWAGPRFTNHAARLNDFTDTAALIENLDLVISADTSTAHLAAAMGKPVWLLSRYSGCWRWLLDTPDSPWYPTLRIYRQTRYAEWGDVMDRVAHDLRAWCAARATATASATHG